MWMYRCNNYLCVKRILPQANHPVFTSGHSHGNFKSLRSQVKLLFGLTAGISQVQAHLLWEHGHKYLGAFSSKLDAARAKYVARKEGSINFGYAGDGPWVDVEADEVDLHEEFVSNDAQTATKAKWDQWAGIVQRGKPS